MLLKASPSPESQPDIVHVSIAVLKSLSLRNFQRVVVSDADSAEGLRTVFRVTARDIPDEIAKIPVWVFSNYPTLVQIHLTALPDGYSSLSRVSLVACSLPLFDDSSISFLMTAKRNLDLAVVCTTALIIWSFCIQLLFRSAFFFSFCYCNFVFRYVAMELYVFRLWAKAFLSSSNCWSRPAITES